MLNRHDDDELARTIELVERILARFREFEASVSAYGSDVVLASTRATIRSMENTLTMLKQRVAERGE